MRRVCPVCHGKGSTPNVDRTYPSSFDRQATVTFEAAVIVDHLTADVDWLRGVYGDADGQGRLADVGRLLVDARDRLAGWLEEYRWQPPEFVPCDHETGYCAACEPFVEVQS